MNGATAGRRLARAERRVDILEHMIEDKQRELRQLQRELSVTSAELDSTHDLIPTALLVVDLDRRIVRANHMVAEVAGRAVAALEGHPIETLWPAFALPAGADREHLEVEWLGGDGAPIPMLVAMRRTTVGADCRILCIAHDLRDRRREDEARRRAQRLESLGQLAAGIAHEVNTPMQFIGDNVQLMRSGFAGVTKLLQSLSDVHAAAVAGEVPPALLDAVMEAQRDARWSYYAARLDRAFTRAQDGIDRVSQIVSALKVFSHPRNELAPVDVNRALSTTIVVASPEIRHVATVSTELGEVPPVLGYADDLNQVFLNLIVNAAHAIADAARGTRGAIRIRTCATATHAEVHISDTGCGIPDAIRERVFDPFFTTKAPGRGTGQGLALAHAVIVERHHGAVYFDTSPAGTTFHVSIPFAPPGAERQAP